MVTTLSTGQMLSLTAILAVAILLAPALLYLQSWLGAGDRTGTGAGTQSCTEEPTGKAGLC
jgi:hypothetical protein